MLADAELNFRFPSSPAEIAPVRQAIERRCAIAGFDERACGEIGLCVNEALANVIRHAYRDQPGRPIELSLAIEGEGTSDLAATIRLRDWGNRVDPLEHPLPAKVHDPMQPGGLGMICMFELMDVVVFERQADGMLLTLRRYLDRTKRAAAPLRSGIKHG